MKKIIFMFICCYFNSLNAAIKNPDVAFEFDDVPLNEAYEYPAWFKQSFLNLQEDLADAKEAGKKGIIIYFGQYYCPYCKLLIDVNFKDIDIMRYVRKNWDVIHINTRGREEVTDVKGKILNEHTYAVQEKTTFTPSLLFYNTDGEVVLRLRGYHPPYTFHAALTYVAEKHYLRETLAAYLSRGDQTLHFDRQDLIEEPFFSSPPYLLNRTKHQSNRPLAIFFEKGNCHGCDILHAQPLARPAIQKLFYQFETIQLDTKADTPLETPQGEKTTAKEWAQKLAIFHTPTLIFFDEQGKEIIRIDSVVHFFRLHNILNYVLSKAYLSHSLLFKQAHIF